MTIQQTRKVLQQISNVEADIAELKRCRVEIAKKGYASATMSSGNGSQSYTRLDIDKITQAIKALTEELSQLRAMLNGGAGNGIPGYRVLTVYS